MEYLSKRDALKLSLAGALIVPLRTFAGSSNPRLQVFFNKSFPSSAYSWASGTGFDAMKANAAAFFGQARGGYLSPYDLETLGKPVAADRMTVSSQFLRTMNGRAHPEVATPEGYKILGASLPRQSMVKGFVLTAGGSSDIVAAALLHSNCGKAVYGDLKGQEAPGRRLAAGQTVQLSAATRTRTARLADEYPMLTIFFSKRVPRNDQIAGIFIRHVRDLIEEQNGLPGMPAAVRVKKLRVEARRV